MNVKNLAIIPLLVAGAVAVQASTREFPDVPKVAVKLPASAKAGQTVQGTVVVTIGSGLHAYQNPPSKDYMIPLSVSVATQGAKLKSAKYPVGKTGVFSGESARVYEGTVRIPVSVVLPKKHGKQQISFKVHYQECNQSACFPPGDVVASAPVNVK